MAESDVSETGQGNVVGDLLNTIGPGLLGTSLARLLPSSTQKLREAGATRAFGFFVAGHLLGDIAHRNLHVLLAKSCKQADA